ncbi:MAG: hypothetical protein KF851_03295 [Pirellulaceae bacterium]|nr:hypothetical protein [Pirellulaceae bacterium]
MIETRMPDAGPREVARIATVMLSMDQISENATDPDQLERIWELTNLRLQAAVDQHEAITRELEELASSDPQRFSSEQVWTLIRAIKVQSQLLKLCWYPEAVDSANSE